MAKRYAGQGFASVFLYTREAHPGEQFPAHRSGEQKLAHARAFIERYGIERPVLVDDLAGTGHRAYGLLPNMTYLVSQAGRVLFRADWTDAATMEAAIQYVLARRGQRREGLRLKPFYAEFVGHRWSDQAAFDDGLEVAGPQAVEDFARAMKRWEREGAAPGRVRIDEG